MQPEIYEKLNEIIAKTNNDDIIWKRISPVCYSFEKSIPYDLDRKLLKSAEILYTVTKTEGNFLMTGHDIRYEFEILNKDNEETVYRISSNKDAEEETKKILCEMYNAIESQQKRKIAIILNASL